MKHSYILVAQNEEKGYKLWNIFDVENKQKIYEVDKFETGQPLCRGSLEQCKKYIEEEFEDELLY